MKTLLSVLLLLVAASLLPAQSKSVREEEQLRGPVSTIRVEVTRTDGQPVASSKASVENLVFDEKGNVLRQEVYKSDGSLEAKLSWGHVYDDQGRETKTYYYNAEGALTNTGVSVYDDKGRRIETTQINPNGSINHIRAYFYDKNGNNVREAHRNENGSPRNVINRQYDANGRVTEEIFIDSGGALHNRNTFTYDAHGNQTESWLFKKDGNVLPWFRRSLKYDERGNVIEAVNYLSDNSVLSRETFSEFDAHGNWTKTTTSRDVFKEGRSQTESYLTSRKITYF